MIIYSVNLPVGEPFSIGRLHQDPAGTVHGDDQALILADLTHDDLVLHGTVSDQCQCVRLIDIGGFAQRVDGLRCDRHIVSGKSQERQFEGLFPVKIRQVIERLPRKRLKPVVDRIVIGIAEIDQIYKLQKHDCHESNENACAYSQIFLSPVDLLTLDQIVVIAGKHGAEEPGELQALGSCPVQTVIGAQRFLYDDLIGIFFRRDVRQGLWEHISGFAFCKDTQDVLSVVCL